MEKNKIGIGSRSWADEVDAHVSLTRKRINFFFHILSMSIAV